MKCRKNLEKIVIKNSHSNEWEKAKKEWIARYSGYEITDCVCGQKDIRYVFSIQHKKDRHVLNPIGSSCILYFGEEDMKEVVKQHEKEVRDIKNACDRIDYDYEEPIDWSVEDFFYGFCCICNYIVPLQVLKCKENMCIDCHIDSEPRLERGKFKGRTFKEISQIKWYVDYVRVNAKHSNLKDFIDYCDKRAIPL